MAVSLDDKLVVAISSRALFNLEEENAIFEAGDDTGYMKLQLERLDVPAKPGIAYSLVRKLLRFNDDGIQRVEVVILSRNDPVSGMRIFRSGVANGISILRGVFTQGRAPFGYLRALRAHLFLSANEQDVREALSAGFPAARVLVESVHASDAYPNEVRIAFDGDAVLFSDEAERVFQ
ncbi:MAG: 5'-nucleotidase, partial [Gammaproteobacteria bacterium]|nr:5'-nucleotidase [Gammaproteobacteria bacterium]